MSSFRRYKRRAIRQLRHARYELSDAIYYIRRNRFERAENEIAEALRYEGRAIRRINKAERKS